jgi:hypothetical protein
MQILAEAEDVPKTANIKTQLISLWTASVFGVVLLIAFVAFPGFFPPMFNLCGIMFLPIFVVTVVQMKRMATQSHVFAYCYLTAAVKVHSRQLRQGRHQ